jgi:ligand-binding sensor domain-containing protein
MLPDFFTQYPLIFHPPDVIADIHNRQFSFTDRVVDTWQRLWIGTDGFGPMEADMYTYRLESRLQSMSGISPRDVHLHDNKMWIGGMSTGARISGITLWDRTRATWSFFEAPLISRLGRDDVSSISGNDRYVAFGTILGVAVYDIKNDKWQTITTSQGLEGNDVRDVLVSDSVIYVATEFVFNWIDLTTMRVSEMRQTTLDHVNINQLAIDDSVIWAATRFGLYSINITDGEISFHESRAAVVDYDLSAIEIINNEIWVAGSNGIIYWNRETNDWHSFPALEFKANYRDIAATRNNIWFATNRGVLKYDRKRDYWRLFDDTDGLISKNTFHIDVEKQHLWISTDQGVSKFLWHRKGRID